MSANKYQPHVLVLPEDDANSQLANGFVLEVKHNRRIQILTEAGGWLSVCERFVSEHVKGMRDYPERYLVLLLDFDGQTDRADKVKEKVPDDLKSRVFVLGVQSEPEELKKLASARSKILAGRWVRNVVKELMMFGHMISYDTMWAKLAAWNSLFATFYFRIW